MKGEWVGRPQHLRDVSADLNRRGGERISSVYAIKGNKGDMIRLSSESGTGRRSETEARTRLAQLLFSRGISLQTCKNPLK